MDEVLPSAMVHRYLGEFEVERMFEVGNCGGLREWGATQEIRRLLYGWDNKRSRCRAETGMRRPGPTKFVDPKPSSIVAYQIDLLPTYWAATANSASEGFIGVWRPFPTGHPVAVNRRAHSFDMSKNDVLPAFQAGFHH
jgi:hypothetical protein